MRQRYTNEFKAKVVLELQREEKTTAQIAAEHGVHPTQLAQWKKEFLEAMPGVFGKKKRELRESEKKHQKEVEHLHKEIGHLTVQVNWLKKNLKNSVSSPKRWTMIERDHPRLSVAKQAELLSINRSSLYYKARPKDSAKLKRREEVLAEYLKRPYQGSRLIAKRLSRKDNHSPVNRCC